MEERTLFQDGKITVSTVAIRAAGATYAPKSVSAVRVDVVRQDVALISSLAMCLLGFGALALMLGYGCSGANDAGEARVFGWGCIIGVVALIMYGRYRPLRFGVFVNVDGREVMVCSSPDRAWSDKLAAAIWDARS
jgi:hypothetical protein